ncbi:hypothetical protein ceV_356 [Chrysochromulina ericina virus CeV-01B]|uniref:Uncharacterized protein n=1 Tax=Chrysochromulina ericina virus CeV-01B TaxID=3070830 RepID=A0A0N9R0U4_9VIRU|nr:hypothetical protein ceV_356 [Chrysochromulina ericina virus]ALH23262.1 hypothetical protein ceV_356 [Chrysochromulina ericina virus CeV-01B]
MTLRKTKKGGKKCGFFNKMFKSKHCKHHHKGGKKYTQSSEGEFIFGSPILGGSSSQQGLKNWLWGVSDVSNHSAPSTTTNSDSKSDNKSHKGGRKSYKRSSKKGGLSSQLVPIGLLAGVLASRKKRHYHKGSKSKTRKGRLDFITHKGDKFYNRNNKRQSFNKSGVKGRPF